MRAWNGILLGFLGLWATSLPRCAWAVDTSYILNIPRRPVFSYGCEKSGLELPAPRSCKALRRLLPPGLDPAVIAASQNVRHPVAPVLRGPRV